MIVRKAAILFFEATLKILFIVNQKAHWQPHLKHMSSSILQNLASASF